MKKKVVPKLHKEVKVKADIITSDDIKIYYTGKFQDFTARYKIKSINNQSIMEISRNDNKCLFSKRLQHNESTNYGKIKESA